jgi:hypothetical protein
MVRTKKILIAAIGTGCGLVAGGLVFAQTPAPAPSPGATSQMIAPSQEATMRMVKLPEGTEVRLKLEEKLSSSTSSEGDTFDVLSVEDIPLSDGTIIRAGYSGRGEVTHVEHNGWLGKSGELNIKADYLKIGDVRVHLRGNKGGEGKGNTGNLVVAAVFFGVFAAAVHGHSIVYPEGTTVTAFVDTDTEIPLPLVAPPQAR